MKNTNIIYQLDFIGDILDELKLVEDDRLYCRHDLVHFLDTARITYILTLEKGLKVDKDIIYTTALLHDLGRVDEIKNGIPHEIGSAKIAKKALTYTDFTEEEKSMIIEAIKKHRGVNEGDDFSSLFSQADNLSRDCYQCKMKKECRWHEDRKNHKIIY